MSQPVNYYKIGLFVFIGLALLVISVILLSSNWLFTKPLYYETYFNESVEGLNVGSVVKFRGVEIGSVSQIAFVGSVYRGFGRNGIDDKYARYIYVKMALDLPFVRGLSHRQVKIDLEKAIQQGLRVRMMPQGLTGGSYLEIDYLAPDRNHLLALDWNPEHFYIPSAPGTFTRLSEIFDEFHKANLPKLFENINTLVVNANKTIRQMNLGAIGDNASAAFMSLKETSNQFNRLVKHFDQTLEEGHLAATLNNLSLASRSIRHSVRKVPRAMQTLTRTLNKADLLLSGQQQQIQRTLNNIAVISQNLRDVSVTAKEYPSRILWGKPPPRIRYDKK